jgi:hypothetical protein
MRRVTRWAFPILLSLTPAAAFPEGIVIRHDAVGCVVAEKFPQFEARFEPVERLGRARLHFRPEGSPYWYSVAMTREGDGFRGVMPKPRKSLKSFSYYIEATDVDFTTSRTEEYSPRVVARPAECGQTLLAAALPAASVVVEAPAGAPALPAGFATSGVTTAGAAGAVTASAAGSGGVSMGLVAGVVGGAAAVAGVAVAVGKGGGSSTPTASGTSPPATSPAPGPSPTPAPIDLTGRWVGTAPDGAISTSGSCAGEQQDMVMVLTQAGSDLSGSYDGTIRVAGPPGCVTVGSHELGTVAGTVGAGTLSVTVTITQPAGIKPTTVTGTFTASRMSGTFQTIGGNGAGTWSANRQ